MPKYHVILNARSGSAGEGSADLLRAAFAERDINASFDSDDDTPLAERVQRAVEGPAEVIIAAGGDGTVTAVASALVGKRKTLGILPLGTANLLARDLQLPLAVADWLDALPTMQTQEIDVGELNGRIFLHKVVVGTIPAIAAAREDLRERSSLTATIAFFGLMTRRLNQGRPLAMEITTSSGETRVDRIRSIAVANNAYDEGLGQLFSRSSLDQGTLTVYVLKRLSFLAAVRLGAEMVLGRWRADELIEIENVRSVKIRMKRPRVEAMIDGEIDTVDVPLEFQILPRALSVLAPRPKEEAPDGLTSTAKALAA